MEKNMGANECVDFRGILGKNELKKSSTRKKLFLFLLSMEFLNGYLKPRVDIQMLY